MIDKAYARKLAHSTFKGIFHSISTDYLNDSQSRLISDFEEERDKILGEGVNKLWDNLISKYKVCEQNGTSLVSEKALACLIRRGVHKTNIQLNGTIARVKLNNYTYYIDKEGAGCNTGPLGYISLWRRLARRQTSLSGEDFAEFLFDFDELIPDFAKEVDDRLLEVKVKAEQYEILSQSVDALGELFLKPKGITWKTETEFTDTSVYVNFNNKTHQTLRKVIPIDKLAEIIQSLPELMRTE